NPGGLASTTYSCSLSITVANLTVTIPVTFNIGSGTGGGATAAAPGTVNLIYQKSNPAQAAVPTIAITGPDAIWNTSVSYSSGTSGWLNLSQINGQLPQDRTIRLAASISSLAVGSYAATLTITTVGGTASVNVNLAVVNDPIIYANPGSAVFFYSTGSS